MSYLEWFSFFGDLMDGLINASSWLVSPIFNFGSVTLSPLFLITFSGLSIYIAVAFVKWLIV